MSSCQGENSLGVQDFGFDPCSGWGRVITWSKQTLENRKTEAKTTYLHIRCGEDLGFPQCWNCSKHHTVWNFWPWNIQSFLWCHCSFLWWFFSGNILCGHIHAFILFHCGEDLGFPQCWKYSKHFSVWGYWPWNIQSFWWCYCSLLWWSFKMETFCMVTLCFYFVPCLKSYFLIMKFYAFTLWQSSLGDLPLKNYYRYVVPTMVCFSL